jgi:hypothetical protein
VLFVQVASCQEVEAEDGGGVVFEIVAAAGDQTKRVLVLYAAA